MSSIPAPVPAGLSSSAAKQARDLHASVVEAVEQVAVAHATNADADRAVTDAQAAYEAEVLDHRGHFSPNEERLSQALASAQIRASDRIKAQRIAGAQQVADDAALAYATHVREHAGELLAEVVASAEKADSTLAKARAEAEKILSPALSTVSAFQQELDAFLPLVRATEHPAPLDWTPPVDHDGVALPPAVREVAERHRDTEAFDAARRASDLGAREREQLYLSLKAAGDPQAAEVFPGTCAELRAQRDALRFPMGADTYRFRTLSEQIDRHPARDVTPSVIA